jgi:hypothetical protein
MAERFSKNDTLLGARVAADDGRVGYIQQVQAVSATGGDTSTPASSATKSSVASGIASVTILAANTARKGAIVTNTDANALYLDLSGGTASSTSYSVAVASGEYYEMPYGYTGLVTGIWAADGTGSALVTEFE